MATTIKKTPFLAEVEKFHPGSPGDQPEHGGCTGRPVLLCTQSILENCRYSMYDLYGLKC